MITDAGKHENASLFFAGWERRVQRRVRGAVSRRFVFYLFFPQERNGGNMQSIPVAPELAWLGGLFQDAGARLYAVGGMIRSPLAGQPVTDIDVCSRLRPEEIVALCERRDLKYVPKGIRYGTVEIHIPRRDGSAFITEHTTFRRDEYGAGGFHRPEKVVFADSLEQDAYRRDFTVNALYLDVLSGEIFDPTGGLQDMERRLIRATTPDPRLILNDDALRILRMIRFGARLGFEIEESTFTAAKECAGGLADVAWERRRDELFKILLAEPEPLLQALMRLTSLGAMEHLLPELLRGDGVEQRRQYHAYTALHHAYHACAATPADLTLRLAALLHDVGKPFAMEQNGASTGDGSIPSPMLGHDRLGAEIAREMLLRLRCPNALTESVPPLIRFHMYDLNNWAKDSTLREFFAAHGREFSFRLAAIREADVIGSGIIKGEVESAERWRRILRQMDAEGAPFSERELDCTGRDIMQWLELPEGGEIGRIKARLLAHCAKRPQDNCKKRLRSLVRGMRG